MSAAYALGRGSLGRCLCMHTCSCLCLGVACVYVACVYVACVVSASVPQSSLQPSCCMLQLFHDCHGPFPDCFRPDSYNQARAMSRSCVHSRISKTSALQPSCFFISCTHVPCCFPPCRRNNVTLSCASEYLQNADVWEYRYCVEVDPSYRPPDRSAAAAAGVGGAVTPSRRVPAPRRQLQARPIEHPLWRNKRGTEVGVGRSRRLG
jgi:hypothetical protein